MPQVAEVFKRMTDAAKGDKNLLNNRNNWITTLFGPAGNAKLIPLLLEGEQGFKHLAAVASTLTTPASPEAIAAMREFNDATIETDTAITGLKNLIGQELAPVFLPVVRDIRDWTVANREWIAADIKSAVKETLAAINDFTASHGGLTKMLREGAEDIKGFATATKDVLDHFGGLKRVLEGVAALLVGNLLLALAAPVIALGKLGIEVTALAAKWVGLRDAAVAAGEAQAGAAASGGAAGGGLGRAIIPGLVALEVLRDWIYGNHNIDPKTLPQNSPLRYRPDGTYDSTGVNDLPGFKQTMYPGVQIPNIFAPGSPETPFVYNPANIIPGYQGPAPEPVRGQVDVRVQVLGIPFDSQVTATPSGDAVIDRVDLGLNHPLGSPW